MADPTERHGPADPDPSTAPTRTPGTPSAPTRPPGAPAAPAPDPLAELVARLRHVGLDPDVEGLSDALWLARWARPANPLHEQDAVCGGGRERPGRPSGERSADRAPGSPPDAPGPHPPAPTPSYGTGP
ncbi:hypothetical protein AB0G49_09775, partial [Streptomyces longwoodensis]